VSQQNTLKAIRPTNRAMSPGQVWLTLIPLFGFVWQFFVVVRIATSIKRELKAKREDLQGQSVNVTGDKWPPTLYTGIAYGVFYCLMFLPFYKPFFAMAATICWICYWIELTVCRKRIQDNRFTAA
jgi:hypothetical protein